MYSMYTYLMMYIYIITLTNKIEFLMLKVKVAFANYIFNQTRRNAYKLFI